MKTYYLQLKDLVLPNLVNYKTDLTNLDRKSLLNYKGSFLYANRSTGTDLFKLNYSIEFLNLDYKNSIGCAYVFLMRENNDSFYFGNKGEVKKVTRNFIQKQFESFVYHVANLKADYTFNNIKDSVERDLLFQSEVIELNRIIERL